MASDPESCHSQIKVSGISDDILNSLLEEPHGDEHDDEQLNTVIRSLEAEINPDPMMDHELVTQAELVAESENDLSADAGIDMDFSWVDMDTVPSSPSDDMNWYIDQYGEEMHDMDEYGIMNAYSQFHCPLWQETYDEMIHG